MAEGLGAFEKAFGNLTPEQQKLLRGTNAAIAKRTSYGLRLEKVERLPVRELIWSNASANWGAMRMDEPRPVDPSYTRTEWGTYQFLSRPARIGDEIELDSNMVLAYGTLEDIDAIVSLLDPLPLYTYSTEARLGGFGGAPPPETRHWTWPPIWERKSKPEGESRGNPDPKEPTLREMIVSKTYPGAPSNVRITVFPTKSFTQPGKYALFDVSQNATFGKRRDTFQEAVEAANKENLRIGQPLPTTQPIIRPVRKLLSPQQISDFDIFRDKVIRRGEKTFVIDTTGQRADIEVVSDVITPEFEVNTKALTFEQRQRMIREVRQTPYLSEQGKEERLTVLEAKPPAVEGVNPKEPWQRAEIEAVSKKYLSDMEALGPHGSYLERQALTDKYTAKIKALKQQPQTMKEGNPAKEPWQMTRDEFSKIYPFKAGADAVHRSAVFGALYQGKPVPPEVLADYPDLRTRESNPGGNPGGNPMSPEEIDQIATKVAAKVLEDIAPSVLDPAGRGLLLHFTEHEMVGAGMVVNEAKAKDSPCNCFTYKDREYCFSPGVIGMMSSKENPEQIAEYCEVGKSYEVKPGIKERFAGFAGAAEAAHKKIEGIPKGERLVPWLKAISEELEKQGIEI